MHLSIAINKYCFMYSNVFIFYNNFEKNMKYSPDKGFVPWDALQLIEFWGWTSGPWIIQQMPGYCSFGSAFHLIGGRVTYVHLWFFRLSTKPLECALWNLGTCQELACLSGISILMPKHDPRSSQFEDFGLSPSNRKPLMVRCRFQ